MGGENPMGLWQVGGERATRRPDESVELVGHNAVPIGVEQRRRRLGPDHGNRQFRRPHDFDAADGTPRDSPTSFQDDMAILAGTANGFGYVADDYADSLATASQLPMSGSG